MMFHYEKFQNKNELKGSLMSYYSYGGEAENRVFR